MQTFDSPSGTFGTKLPSLMKKCKKKTPDLYTFFRNPKNWLSSRGKKITYTVSVSASERFVPKVCIFSEVALLRFPSGEIGSALEVKKLPNDPSDIPSR